MVSLPPSTAIVTTGTKSNKKKVINPIFYIIKSDEELLKSMFVLALRWIE